MEGEELLLGVKDVQRLVGVPVPPAVLTYVGATIGVFWRLAGNMNWLPKADAERLADRVRELHADIGARRPRRRVLRKQHGLAKV